jgi:hypothetical protein
MCLEPAPAVQIRIVVACLALLACRPPGYGKGGDDDGDDGAPVDAAVTIDAPTDGAAAATCMKDFRLDGHGTASTVWLTGDFVAWGGDPAHGAIEFTRGADGAWTGSYVFEAGAHQYKFIVDGSNWINDPTNPDEIDDGFGGKNSLYLCAP